MGAHGGPHSPGARVQLDPDYVVAAVYRTQQDARFDLEDSKGEPPALAQELAVRSALATPIVVEGDCGVRSRSHRSKVRSRPEPIGGSPTSAH